jgi:anti-anti-sigma factor
MTVCVMDRDGVSVVEVAGEVDLVSSEPLNAVLTAQLDQRPAGLVVDLTKIVFLGSAGINVLVDTAERARDHGVALVVAADHRAVLRPLRITGAYEMLSIRPSLDLALTALQAGRTSPMA